MRLPPRNLRAGRLTVFDNHRSRKVRVMTTKIESQPGLLKARTGIEGFDDITHGGLPRGRTTLIEGGPGSGKTIMALESLVNGARRDGEPGIFVAFEERTQQIIANAATFGWDLVELQKEKLFFLDAQPGIDLVRSGAFDLSGMLAGLASKVEEIKARRIVFDAIDVALSLLSDDHAERHEIYRIREWLTEHNLTGMITVKAGGHLGMTASQTHIGFMHFMADCSVILNHDLVQGVSHRNLRVLKYRGSSHSQNESPFVITDSGLEVADTRVPSRPEPQVTTERVTSGIARVDDMLGGGLYRGASVLITGLPGAAKTTLAGKFAEAACLRGERTLFVSFDSEVSEVARNLTSVDIQLQRFEESGLLHMLTARSITSSAEIHLMQIKNAARAHSARCVVIDPVSALAKLGSLNTMHSVAERLLAWSKAAGITLLCTSLLEEDGPGASGTQLQISTLADTWIHLSYLVIGGERNRGLSIIKSRGTWHSNLVRELILNSSGVTLTDVYNAGGEVLMGTPRREKEASEKAARDEFDALTKQRHSVLFSSFSSMSLATRLIQTERSLICRKFAASIWLAGTRSRLLT
jgi:circadian clock protein KaiC